MGLIKWDDQFSVKNAKIDSQHQTLINMINDLHDSMMAGKSKDVLEKTIQGLIRYASEHFSTEEQMFLQYSYPDAASHQQEHKKFIETIEGFSQDFLVGKIGLSIQVMNFLSDWLKNHIMGCDQKYVPYLSGKN
jgi:hemerythrin